MSTGRLQLKIPLDTEEKLQTCVATLNLCVIMARDLADAPLAKEINGSMALEGLAGVLEDTIKQVLDE